MVKPHKAKRNKPFTQQRSKQPVINIGECGGGGGWFKSRSSQDQQTIFFQELYSLWGQCTTVNDNVFHLIKR